MPLASQKFLPFVGEYEKNYKDQGTNQRHKKMIKLAKGYSGRAKNCFKIAKLKVQKGMQYSYKARRVSVTHLPLQFIYLLLFNIFMGSLKNEIFEHFGFSELMLEQECMASHTTHSSHP